jgi:rhamnulokinase
MVPSTALVLRSVARLRNNGTLMERVAKQKALIAIDLGAQSCRVSLLRRHGSDPEIQVVHRSPNSPRNTPQGLCWDAEKIFNGIQTGIQLAAQHASEDIASIAIDGWAVDYVRLQSNGQPAADPFCYRDPRSEKAEQKVHAIISPEKLYSLTGVQIIRINTLYQLYADKLAQFDTRAPWINVPEFMSHCLGGRRVSEYTNATHSGMVALNSHRWCKEIFDTLGLHIEAAPEIVPSGTIIGTLASDFAKIPQLRETKIIAPACHDTASAIAAIPASGEDWAFISSGTWSLVGTVLNAPCVSGEARGANFTNLGGVGGKICFLKNVNGMWLLQQCMEEWERSGSRWSVPELLAKCRSLPTPPHTIDVDDPQLMIPGDAIAKINIQLERAGQPKFSATSDSTIASIANLIFHSLAARYAEVLSSIATITGKKLKRLFIVGGGNQNTHLNDLTAKRTGLEVILGATESTTIGNFAIQLAALEGDYSPSIGVSAERVAHHAEQMISQGFALPGERGAA